MVNNLDPNRLISLKVNKHQMHLQTNNVFQRDRLRTISNAKDKTYDLNYTEQIKTRTRKFELKI